MYSPHHHPSCSAMYFESAWINDCGCLGTILRVGSGEEIICHWLFRWTSKPTKIIIFAIIKKKGNGNRKTGMKNKIYQMFSSSSSSFCLEQKLQGKLDLQDWAYFEEVWVKRISQIIEMPWGEGGNANFIRVGNGSVHLEIHLGTLVSWPHSHLSSWPQLLGD